MSGEYIMLPGARLEAGPSGLYETLGSEAAIAAKSRAESAKLATSSNAETEAVRQLAKMKRSLRGWLKYRRINDEVAAGTRKATKMPQGVAAAEAMAMRDWAGEQKLAEDLYTLVSEVHGPAGLPEPNLTVDPDAAVKLAEIALGGAAGTAASSPEAQGILPLVILTVGGLALFTITSFISNRADVQKEKEHLECIKSGACTDFGFWLKIASVSVIGWFLWEKAGVGAKVKGALSR